MSLFFLRLGGEIERYECKVWKGGTVSDAGWLSTVTERGHWSYMRILMLDVFQARVRSTVS
jgi:hypothetical protein